MKGEGQMRLCEVCGTGVAVQVACSAVGAISFAYCAECLKDMREPYDALVASLYGMSSMDDVAEWFLPVVTATLKAENKSEKELFADVAAFGKEYEEAMGNAEN